MKNQRNSLLQGITLETIKEVYARLLENLPGPDLTAEIEHIHTMNVRYCEAVKAGLRPDMEAHVASLLAIGLPKETLTCLLRLDALAMLIDEQSDEMLERVQIFSSDEFDEGLDDSEEVSEEEIQYGSFLDSTLYFQMHTHLQRRRLSLAI